MGEPREGTAFDKSPHGGQARRGQAQGERDQSRQDRQLRQGAEDIAVFGNQALVIMDDRSLIVVDLASGDRRSFGNLPSLNSPSGIVVDGDRAVLLAEYNDSSSVIVAIDLASEESSILSAFETRGEGPNLREDAQDLALDGDRVLVIDGASIIAVDLATGDRTLLTDYSTGTGPVTGYRRVERTRDGLVLTDWYLGAVLALELQFGQRTILAR